MNRRGSIGLVVLVGCGVVEVKAPPPPLEAEDPVDLDGDGHPADVDCNDADATQFPGAADLAGDGVDHDCSGTDSLWAASLADEAAWSWHSPVAGAHAGRRLSSGDLDGDSRDELVVSAPGPLDCHFEADPNSVCGTDAVFGRVWILASQDRTFVPIRAWVGLGDGQDTIGEYVDASGDANGDGLNDVITGSSVASSLFLGPGPWPGLGSASQVWTSNIHIHGFLPDDDGDGSDSVLLTYADPDADSLVVQRDWRGTEEAGDLWLVGEQASDALSRVPPAFPDLDGDGVAEWLLGAPLHDVGTASNAGAVYVVPAGMHGMHFLAEVASKWTGTVAGGEAGLDVANAGDVDGDGADDVVVGAPLDGSAAPDAGRVFLVRGSSARDGHLDDIATAVIDGELEDDWLGWRLAGPLDADQDGFADLVLGAPGDLYSGLRPGKVHLLFGPLTGTVSAADGLTWVGQEPGSGAGSGLAIGDLDGDGDPDLAVGALRNRTSAGEQAGAVYVLSVFGI